MTQPVPTDFPDYARQYATANKVYNVEVATAVNGSVTRGPYFVGDVSYVAHRLQTTGVNASVAIDYYGSASLTQFIAQQTISAAPTALFGQSLPVLGPWMFITLTGFGAASVNYFVFSSAGPVLNMNTGETANILVNADVAAIGAGATVNLPCGQVWPGEAVWNIWSNSTNWSARVQALTAAGAVVLVDYTDFTYVRPPRTVFLPYCPCRVQITNFDGVGRNYSVALSARPLVPGG